MGSPTYENFQFALPLRVHAKASGALFLQVALRFANWKFAKRVPLATLFVTTPRKLRYLFERITCLWQPFRCFALCPLKMGTAHSCAHFQWAKRFPSSREFRAFGNPSVAVRCANFQFAKRKGTAFGNPFRENFVPYGCFARTRHSFANWKFAKRTATRKVAKGTKFS